MVILGVTGLNSLCLCVLGKPAQRVYQLHLLDRITAGLEKARRTNKISKALRARDRDVEAIAGEKKSEITRHVFAAGRCHRKEQDRRLLAVTLVDCPNPNADWIIGV